MVHQGFLRSWQHNGLCARVLDLVGELAAHMQAEGRTAKVFITGQVPAHMRVVKDAQGSC